MKLAVIGVGRMGRRHIRVVKDLDLELVGVCDYQPESLALAEKECDVLVDQQFSDVRVMLEQTQPEAVIVATTAPTHASYTCLAAAMGARYILSEKPLAVSLAQAEQMIAACQQHGAKLAINHYMRFIDFGQEIKRIVESAAFGGFSSMTVAAANIGLAMVGSHYIELFHWLSGETSVQTTAWLERDPLPNPRGAQFEDRAGSLRLVTASGKRFYLEAGVEQGHGVKLVVG